MPYTTGWRRPDDRRTPMSNTTAPEPSYSDSERLDELAALDDYNRYEEEQVFRDHEGTTDE
jgi:hypothetical protein